MILNKISTTSEVYPHFLICLACENIKKWIYTIHYCHGNNAKALKYFHHIVPLEDICGIKNFISASLLRKKTALSTFVRCFFEKKWIFAKFFYYG